ncbi:MAG: hypothetical protein KUG78_02130, partial [Kangiellaceae bacterium]|nr:hypothetical protein [Kangiellaceae bacterium]
DLQETKHFELLIFWPLLKQQYRIRGELTEIASDVMKEHWVQKPYESKLLDQYYRAYQPQTSSVDSRDVLQSGIKELKERYPSDKDIPFPDNAKGIAIKATYLEIWQGSDSNRLHHRDLYLLSDGCWKKQVLVP